MSDINTVSAMGHLKTDRSAGMFILLSIVTLGIYTIVFYSGISQDINTIASRYDGKNTMHYCLIFFLLGPVTIGIMTLVWFTQLSGRIGTELRRRGINYSFGGGTFWGWNVLGIFILVGPFIYAAKICKAFNLLAEDYNVNG